MTRTSGFMENSLLHVKYAGAIRINNLFIHFYAIKKKFKGRPQTLIQS